MRNDMPRLVPAALAVALLSAHAARAAGFTVIAVVPGGPQIGLLRGATLYGTVAYEGAGTLFSLTTAGTYSSLHNFAAASDGSAPNARLAIDPSGNIYGTARGGGANGGGTLWKYAAGGVMSTPHAFGASGDGAVPMQGPTLGANYAIVGTTGEGAIGGSGNIFSLARGGGYSVLYDFLSGADGHCPFSGVAIGKTGTIYGTAVGVGFGGNPNGSVWQYTAAGGLQTLYVFQDGADGEWPDQAPALDNAGNLYGTTHVQNARGFPGAIWKISASGTFSVLHDLNEATDGSGPNSPLLLDTDQNLYGTTAVGGAANQGTVFRITPSGAFSVVYSFTGGADGGQPTGNLVHDASGAIYGGTAYGTVFKIVP